MSGTRIGGLRARDKNLANDPDFYKKIGTKGGRNGHTGGFAAMDKNKVRAAGSKGGSISRRKPSSYYKKDEEELPVTETLKQKVSHWFKG